MTPTPIYNEPDPRAQTPTPDDEIAIAACALGAREREIGARVARVVYLRIAHRDQRRGERWGVAVVIVDRPDRGTAVRVVLAIAREGDGWARVSTLSVPTELEALGDATRAALDTITELREQRRMPQRRAAGGRSDR